MKTQIIQLEPHDDVISVRDKMGWSQTGRVVLVWPTRGGVLERRLDLVILLRHSQSLGVQIALVTRDPEVHFQARSLGIPVYKSIRKAQRSRWRKPTRKRINSYLGDTGDQERASNLNEILADPLHRKEQSPQLSLPVRIGLFTLSVFAVLAIVAIFIPSAEITISPETRQQEIILSVEANDSVNKINLSGILPLKSINTIVEGRASTKTSGTVQIPSGYATGRVTFINLTDRPIVIPAGTVVSNADSSQRFVTQRAARLSAGPGTEIETTIEAVTPGSSGNLSAGSITAIEGDLGLFLTVENQGPILGGSLSLSPAPSTLDRIELHDQLVSTLEQNALQEIQTSLNPDDILLDETPMLVNSIEESFFPSELQPANELELILRLEYEVQIVSGEDLDSLAEAILDANLPEGFNPIPGTTLIKHLTTPQLDEGSPAHWRIQFTRNIQVESPISQAISLSLGLSPKNASQRLMETLPLSATPKIKINPAWWPVMPLIPLRISVTSTGVDQAHINSQMVSLK
jgi:hypothetical protein